MIWAFHDTAVPTSQDIPNSLRHTHRGSQSLNLLGGLPSAAPDPDDLEYYDVTLDNVNRCLPTRYHLLTRAHRSLFLRRTPLTGVQLSDFLKASAIKHATSPRSVYSGQGRTQYSWKGASIDHCQRRKSRSRCVI